MHELLVALSFDVDNDFCDNPKESEKLSWRGLDEGVPLALSALAAVSDEIGAALPSSWFIRMDAQVQTLCGDATWAAQRFREKFGAALAQQGGEVQWHAHLYRHDASGWHNELDGAAQADQLRRAYAAMRGAGFECSISRVGESLFSNAISSTLRELGMRADSTAMPGRYREDCFDWRGTPVHAHRQDSGDYRKPSRKDGLLQLPFSMLKVQADYDAAPFSRYLNLGFLHRVMAEPLRDVVSDAPYLVCVGHPFELLPEAKHPLWGGSVANFVANLRSLIDSCARAKRPLRFVTMSELAAHCEGLQDLQDSLGAPAVDQALRASR